MRPERRPVVILGLLAGLLGAGCEQPDYSGASFKPPEKPVEKGSFLLHVYRPAARPVPWGDAAFFHRATPAARAGQPVAYRARLGDGPWVESDDEGGVRLEALPGSRGLAVRLGGATKMRRVEVTSGRMEVGLWSVDPGGRVLGVHGIYDRTDLESGPISAVAGTVAGFRDFLSALEAAFAAGEPAALERLLTEDFRDAHGGRGSFVQEVVHRQGGGEPYAVVGDAFARLDEETARLEIALERGGRRTFPTLELVRDRRGAGGYRVRSLY